MAYLAQSPAGTSFLSASAHTKHVPDNDEDLYCKAVDFTEVERILLATAEESGFRRIIEDTACGITLYSRPVENCPIHLMRAEAPLPCSPTQLLAYLDVSTRRAWDDYIAELRSVRRLHRPRNSVKYSDNDMTDVPEVTGHTLRELLPGQRRVSLHYMAVRSPILLVQNRDFEMVVAEEVRRDGSAWLQAFSTPLGYIEPLDPQQSKYVRGLMLFSGILAKPIVDAEGQGKCRVSYVALVHPMGLIPPVLVNMVLGAQLTVLRKLQKFITSHPLVMLYAESETCANKMCNGANATSGNSGSINSSTGKNTNTTTKEGSEKKGQETTNDLFIKGRGAVERRSEDGRDQSGEVITAKKKRRTVKIRRQISSLKGRVSNWFLSNL